MKKLNKVIAIYLSLIYLFSYTSFVQGGKVITLDDIISNQIVDLRLVDRCGDIIPSDRKAFDRCKKQTGGPEKYPPIASEACAYDRVGDQLRLSFDEAQVSDNKITTHINVYDESNTKIYDNQIAQLPFNLYARTKREESWPLLMQNGGALNVGRQGKKYIIQMERRNAGKVLYSTGKLDVFVDDCKLRNDKILRLIDDSSIYHSPGFDLYLKLLNRVSTKLCNRIEVGLLANDGTNTFSQRCRYQCINNYFTNKMIDSTALPLSANDFLNNTHRRVTLANANAIHLVDNIRTGPEWLTTRFSLLAYITMEDNYRAGGYVSCNGPLNSVDAEKSISVIELAVDEIVTEVPSLGFTGIGEAIFGQIRMHLNRTEALYLDIVGE